MNHVAMMCKFFCKKAKSGKKNTYRVFRNQVECYKICTCTCVYLSSSQVRLHSIAKDLVPWTACRLLLGAMVQL